MTLKQAQKQYDDAIQMTVKHKPNSVTAAQLEKWAQQSWNVPIKVLFTSVGKTSSRVIYSRKAAIENLSKRPKTK
nr:MAG TPA: hypothetical protein [Caudoviricetes sp.]